jgi:HTH-type transcriptional regulator / antitoxin HipB
VIVQCHIGLQPDDYIMMLRTPIDFGFAIRDRRRRLHLRQDQLAARVGVSRKWIIDVEKGKPRAEIGLLLRTLDALGLRLSLDSDGYSAGVTGFSDIPAVDIDSIVDNARIRRG